MDINEVTKMIKDLANSLGKTPTISEFSDKYNLHAATIVRKFGSWNTLLLKAGLKPNKSTKRSREQLLMWLKSHPNSRYSEIPYGIRSGLIDKFETVANARLEAGLSISDWRSFSKRTYRKKPLNAGRPVEYTEDVIISGLQSLAKKLGRPPKIKEITKENCGFPFTAIISRFKSFNDALKASNLPPSYSYQEYNKLNKDLSTIMLNIKINISDVPESYQLEFEGIKPTFVYKDRIEDVFLTRSEIENSIKRFSKIKDKKIIIWYLVDDSLYENDNVEIKNIMNITNANKKLKDMLISLRLRYDEINRKYLAPLKFLEGK